ncbi:hypothetical protein B0H10DRAFT_65114 [Mycena sp. CBHHK59/15]|nr:hypothetical protein B0H10DRAFT_65114 [Mycena sp. CBHHK59/15]
MASTPTSASISAFSSPHPAVVTSEICSFVLSEETDSRTKKDIVQFHDYRGPFAPCTDIGSLGDTFIDTRARELYALGLGGWVKWPGPKQRSAPLEHPLHQGFFLWCSTAKNRVSWYRRSRMKKIISSAADVISQIIAAERKKNEKKRKAGTASLGAGSEAKKPRVSESQATDQDAVDPPPTIASAPPTLQSVIPSRPVIDGGVSQHTSASASAVAVPPPPPTPPVLKATPLRSGAFRDPPGTNSNAKRPNNSEAPGQAQRRSAVVRTTASHLLISSAPLKFKAYQPISNGGTSSSESGSNAKRPSISKTLDGPSSAAPETASTHPAPPSIYSAPRSKTHPSSQAVDTSTHEPPPQQKSRPPYPEPESASSIPTFDSIVATIEKHTPILKKSAAAVDSSTSGVKATRPSVPAVPPPESKQKKKRRREGESGQGFSESNSKPPESFKAAGSESRRPESSDEAPKKRAKRSRPEESNNLAYPATAPPSQASLPTNLRDPAPPAVANVAPVDVTALMAEVSALKQEVARLKSILRLDPENTELNRGDSAAEPPDDTPMEPVNTVRVKQEAIHGCESLALSRPSVSASEKEVIDLTLDDDDEDNAIIDPPLAASTPTLSIDSVPPLPIMSTDARGPIAVGQDIETLLAKDTSVDIAEQPTQSVGDHLLIEEEANFEGSPTVGTSRDVLPTPSDSELNDTPPKAASVGQRGIAPMNPIVVQVLQGLGIHPDNLPPPLEQEVSARDEGPVVENLENIAPRKASPPQSPPRTPFTSPSPTPQPTVETSTTPDHFRIDGIDVPNRQLLNIVAQTGGGETVARLQKWGQILAQLHLSTGLENATKFSKRVWEDTARALETYYMLHLLSSEGEISKFTGPKLREVAVLATDPVRKASSAFDVPGELIDLTDSPERPPRPSRLTEPPVDPIASQPVVHAESATVVQRDSVDAAQLIQSVPLAIDTVQEFGIVDSILSTSTETSQTEMEPGPADDLCRSREIPATVKEEPLSDESLLTTPPPLQRRLTQTQISLLFNVTATTIHCMACIAVNDKYELPVKASLEDLAAHSELRHPAACDLIQSETEGKSDEEIHEWFESQC